MVEPQALSSDARLTAISWTGGKDCNLALLDAWRNPALHVTSLVVFRPQDAVFRAHPLKLAEAQAECLGLQLLHVIIPSDAPNYKAAYVSGMRQLRAEHGIEVIATGDTDLVGSMARNWIEECGEEAGIEAYLPLWQAERGVCLRRLLAEGFVVVFSCVKSPWFDSRWVGRRLDAAALQAMEVMAAAPPPADGVKPLDLGGERGEYHTMALAGPLYRRPVPLEAGEPLELVGQPGQKAGERWWTIGMVDAVVPDV
mmetsp:Transcript_43031/g.133775  ORF Transcript_43031/g.133775 Transcript_43031/m.133775 type:complete len:255 (-) Transcript_43031:140-904(-)